jgi:hypothetical protein
LDVVVHACNPSTQEGLEFEINLGYTVRPYFKKYLYIMEHVFQSGTDSGEQARRERRKDR